MSVKTTLFGEKALLTILGVVDSVTETQDVLDTAGAFLLFKIKERFLRQEAPGGEVWPESQAAKGRKKSNQGGGTLFDTGTLFHSITLGRYGKNRSIFTDVTYADDHQRGINGQLQREFLGFNAGDETGVETLINARIVAAINS